MSRTLPRRNALCALFGAMLALPSLPQTAAWSAQNLPTERRVETAATPTGLQQAVAVTGPPATTLDQYKQVWSLITTGRLDEAERMLRLIRSRIPAEFKWLTDDAQAWIAFYRKDYNEAEAAFENILAGHTGAYMSRKGLGFLAIEQKRFDDALTYLLGSYRQNPYQVLPSYTIPAAKLIKAKRYAQADKILRLAEWVYPKSADVAFLSAKAYVGLGDRERAAKMAVAAAIYAPAYIHPEFESLRLDPTLVREAYAAMGWGLLVSGDAKAALRRFQQYFSSGGTGSNGYRGRGFALFRLERYRDAVQDLAVAAADEPKTLPPITDVVPIPGSKQRWKITYNATSTMGWAYLRLSNPDKAEAAFRSALETYPDWIDALTGLGYSLLARGNTRAAAEKFRDALELSEGYPDALRGLKSAGDTQ